jgi:hypothetical protein
MIRTTRVVSLTWPALAAVSWLCAASCGGSNNPATTTGSGGDSSTTGDGPTTSAGTTGAGGDSSTTAAATTGAGTTTTGGSTTGAGGGNTGTFTPLCAGLTTAAGAAPTKGGACTAPDPQLCYKTCGPQGIGFKSETCTGGVYAEQSGCTFPTGEDYSCYKIPAAIDASCPATAPKASDPCTVAACTLCNANGQYLDSSGASKAGYCVCPAASGMGTSKWSCASTTAWPCPAGSGC